MDQLAERLRTERERQGRSLAELSAQTKIREPFLEAIELGRYGVLPPVYVRSFIRTYAQALRLPMPEINVLIERVLATDDDDRSFVPQSLRNPSRVSPPPHQTSKPRLPIKDRIAELLASLPKPTFAMPTFLHGRRGLLILAILVVLVGVLYLVVQRSSTDGDGTSTDSSTTISVGQNGNPLDSMILTALASDTSWLTITMDSNRTQQIVMLPGQEQRWSAMKEFKVALGNAGALTFSRNGVTLPPLGKKGEAVRSVLITRNDVVSSASASRPPTTVRPAATPQQQPVQKAKPAQQQRVVAPAPVVRRPAVQRAPQPVRRRLQQPQRRKPVPQVRRAAVNAPRRPTITPAPVIPR
ncbi:hypothetical protein BH10BAC6_BH10BAC6_03750 [soil metagenome]